MRKNRADESSATASPAGKRRRASPLQFWCDSFDRPKHVADVLKRWHTSEHRIRHARGSLQKGDAVPASLKHAIDVMEGTMQPLPFGTELYFATYDPKWKYNPRWWLPCSRTPVGAEKAVRHLHHDPPAGARLRVHKLVVEEGVSGVWCGDLGLEHDDEEEIVLAAGLELKRSQGRYRVSLPDPHRKKAQGRTARRGAEGSEEEDEGESAAADESIDGDATNDEEEESDGEGDAEEAAEEKPAGEPSAAGWNCIVS